MYKQSEVTFQPAPLQGGAETADTFHIGIHFVQKQGKWKNYFFNYKKAKYAIYLT